MQDFYVVKCSVDGDYNCSQELHYYCLFIYLVGYFNKDFRNHLYNYPTIVRVFFYLYKPTLPSFRCFIGPTLTERLGNGTPPWALLGQGEEKGGLREALAGHEAGAAHGDREVFRSGRRRVCEDA